MKHRYFLLVCVAFIISCTPTIPAPTVTPIAQITETAEPPASTTVATPAVETPTLTMTAVEAADTPTLTATPTLPADTPTLTPTEVAPTPTIIPTPGPPILDSQIVFLWDPNPVRVAGGAPNEPSLNLYRASPGTNPAEWHVETLMADLQDWPQMLPSPDGDKLAITLLYDTNNDGYVDQYRGTDIRDLYVYSLTDASLIRATISIDSINHFSWMPDSESLVYAHLLNTFLAKLDGSPEQPLTHNPNFPLVEGTQSDWISNLVGSPDGRLIALDLMLGNVVSGGGVQSFSNSLTLFYMDTGELVSVIEDIS